MKQMVFNTIIFVMILGLYLEKGITLIHNKGGTLVDIIHKTDTLSLYKDPNFFLLSPEEGLWEAIDYYGLQYPEIVYAQAILETGHFKSDLCINSNNLFGLYDSINKEYFRFNHWSESVLAYRDMVQYKYKPPNDYYQFLKDLPYAEDKEYINKIKNIVSRYE